MIAAGRVAGSPAARSGLERWTWLVVLVAAAACDAGQPPARSLEAQEPIPRAEFAALVQRISEDGGYFDTDNLISNETGYLNVMDALGRRGLQGGAYVGVGPDQNYSYIAQLRPDVAFLTDVRRDNVLQHLLLKALIEHAPTRVEFLSALHGVTPPADPSTWEGASVEAVVAWVDSAWAEERADPERRGDATADFDALHDRVRSAIDAYGLPLSESDFVTIRRFHRSFADQGLSLRFTSFGRPPRPYYPTYRQLTLETDVDGDRVSYLASSERYAVVRDMHRANRIIPVVGDLAGRSALRALGDVMREMGVELRAFYVSNVEFYLWQLRTFDRWLGNARALPANGDAVVIRSYFGNFRGHPSAVPGYYATQTLQPWSTLVAGGFSGYWETITRDVIPLD
ncbi:MAG: hypothetical protein AMS19_04605 [Gemmatimonas sp. SG8_23]|nr:MAG: hypothetical protein AMS19_04605 [Gemmatimonas sp. SG8_23]